MLFCHAMTASEVVNSFYLRLCYVTIQFYEGEVFQSKWTKVHFFDVKVRNFTLGAVVYSNEEWPSMATLFIYGDHVIATMTENEKLTELLLRCLTHSLQVQCQGYSEVVGTLESYLL